VAAAHSGSIRRKDKDVAAVNAGKLANGLQRLINASVYFIRIAAPSRFAFVR
jgi:hypothetical protein